MRERPRLRLCGRRECGVFGKLEEAGVVETQPAGQGVRVD